MKSISLIILAALVVASCSRAPAPDKPAAGDSVSSTADETPLASAHDAGATEHEQFSVLRLADYEATTGCVGAEYIRPIRSALGFLVFDEAGEKSDNDLQYARRHTLPLFRSLHQKYATPDGSVASRCIPASLRQIGLALKLLDADGGFGKATTPDVNFVYDPALLEHDTASPKAFPVMARLAYIEQTGCAVSGENYGKYRVAFEWAVFSRGYPDRARANMIEFLDTLYAETNADSGRADSETAASDVIDQRCMIPAISRIAEELDLLDDTGRYQK